MADKKWSVNIDKTAVVDELGRRILLDPSVSLFDLSITEREANLKLAASAPEMLEALRSHVCVQAIQGEGMNFVDYYPVEKEDCQMCQVIASLEGNVSR